MKKLLSLLIIFLIWLSGANYIQDFSEKTLSNINESFYWEFINEQEKIVVEELKNNPEIANEIIENLENWNTNKAIESFIKIVDTDDYEEFVREFMKRYENWELETLKNNLEWMDVEDFEI